ncbi:hypothetical protein LTR37_016259 [Vermiconidia calcicola]|uniref:Uncharacterized protein n=1 Tax=Vermiconidia calcicola TaxID=1690605 RepID=A0ACC3MPX6_9PEZI|nr:hypothetical protein LTR37_016259 [Vermiconidia calcicola]
MQPSARQEELERLYNARRGHVPHISISDDEHHVTEAIGSYYDDGPTSPVREQQRPYSFVTSPSEVYEGKTLRTSKRNGSYFDMNRANSPRVPLGVTGANEKVPSPTESGSISPKSVKRMGSLGSENANGGAPVSPPPLSRQSSTETAVSQFPLNDIDYESSPAAVAQELSNLQAIRRMSMNVDMADPDLPSFAGVVPTVAPKSEDEDDTSRLFWVPASLHPELAPKEFKTFVEERVDKIRRRSGDSDNLSADGLERQGSGSLRRKKSMLSRQINSQDHYEDGAERLERKRSKRMPAGGPGQVDLNELESLVSDPAQLMRRMSLDTVRRSQDSGVEVPASEDMPILPPVGQSLKRSTRTTYRRGSLKKGERVPFSKRAQHRQSEPDSSAEESSVRRSATPEPEEPILGLTRVQTEPTPLPARDAPESFPSRTESSFRWRQDHPPSQTEDDIATRESLEDNRRAQATRESLEDSRRVQATRESLEESRRVQSPVPVPERDQQPPPRPQQRQFHSRLASGPGRTTAQLPGYNNQNPLPHIIETLPDGTKVPSSNLMQQIPERKSSHELPRPFQRGGAHMRPVPGRERDRDHQRSSTLDDISANPSPLPGSGATRTDALTMVPTFEDHKRVDKKEGPRKSSWKWKFGSNDEEKEEKAEKAKEEKTSMDSASVKSLKTNKLSKIPGEKARLDVLQNSIDGTTPSRGRESIVLNRDDVRLDEERKRESKKLTEPKKDKDKDKDSSLLSVFFGGKKKASDGDLKEKRRKADRNISPDPAPRILKPDIDYNWTRFSILEERAIYRMAHIKLANPRRALYSQVLLSNFMYSYLAKVQMMHPQVQIPPAHQKAQQRGVKQEEQQQQQPAEYNQYQKRQKQQDREAVTDTNSAANPSKRTSLEIATGGAPQQQQQQQQNQRTSYDYDEDSSTGYDTRSSEEYDHDQSYQAQVMLQQSRTNGNGTSGGGGGGGSRGGGYSVANTHDYLGYPKDRQPFGSQGLWEDDQKDEEMW